MAGIPEHFRVDTHERGDGVAVELNGELDMAGTFMLEPRLDELVAARPEGGVTFDLRGLSFVDSTGLTILVDRHRRLEEAGVPTRFHRGRDDVQRVFTVSGFDDVLPFAD
jgi:anti-sigma B factor antagonist